jgi:hypothetical protein
VRRGLLAPLLAIAACGGDDGTDPPQGDDVDVKACAATVLDGDLAARLASIPCLTAMEIGAPRSGVRAFQLRITQPVDHAEPDGQTFTQDVTLLHVDAAAPMVMVESGYINDYNNYELEPTRLLDANQIIVEHRFFDDSRPSPADWTKLTIAQQAADDHRTIVALKQIYAGAWLTTGASKGGMTTTYHRRMFPDDVDATLPYVAPISFAIRDPRYVPHLDTLGPQACRENIRAVQRELLLRRSMLETRARQLATTRGLSFTRIQLEAAVEAAVVGLDWAYWQYAGVNYCSTVPATTASDDALWAFLDAHYSVQWYADDDVAAFEAYYYQAEAELGYPVEGNTTLTDLLQFDSPAYDGLLPVGVPKPTLRTEAMQDIADWIASEGARFIFVYGQWDPWSGGMYELGDATDSLRVVAPMETHGAQIADLASSDRIEVLNKLQAWTGTSLRVRPQDRFTVRRPAPPMLLRR